MKQDLNDFVKAFLFMCAMLTITLLILNYKK